MQCHACGPQRPEPETPAGQLFCGQQSGYMNYIPFPVRLLEIRH